MSAAKKVLLTGASGLLGRQIYAAMKENGWDVLGLAYSRAKGGLVKADLLDIDNLKKIFGEYKPSIVIHSAAERRPDQVKNDEEKAKLLNVSVSESIASLCSSHQCYLIYISTDYVFDGTSPPYRPDDKPNPLNLYGEMKHDGELATLTYPKSSIVRVPILYGPIEYLEESAVTILYKAFQTEGKFEMNDHELRYPTHTKDIANFICQLSDRSLSEPDITSGIWHCSTSDPLTKYQMSLVMAKVFNLSTDHLIRVREPSKGVARPYNNLLDCSKTEKHFNLKFVSFECGIRNVLQEFVKM